jgi:predicted ester cyclase
MNTSPLGSATPGKDLVRRWFLEGMNSGDALAARKISEEVFAVDFIDHDGIERATYGREQWQQAVIGTVFSAFCDIDVTLEKLLAEDELVAVRYRFVATHTGPFRGIPATHRRIHHSENEIYRIADGRIAESWGEGDWLGTFQQLGSWPR